MPGQYRRLIGAFTVFAAAGLASHPRPHVIQAHAVKSHLLAQWAGFPMAMVSLSGRIEDVYPSFAQLWAIAPGLPRDYLRIAYNKLTLAECALESRVRFGCCAFLIMSPIAFIRSVP